MIASKLLRPILSSPLKHRNPIRTMHIQPIPMWTDNYAYLVTDESSHDGVIIDPADPPSVLPTLQSLTSSSRLHLTAILNTHHHRDHAGGNRSLLTHFPSLPIIGGRDCDAVTRTPAHNSQFRIGRDITVTALHTPCHTLDSICYYVEDGSKTPVERAVFTGDTLFIGGCGRFFEGTAEQMHTALNETLAGLPEETRLFPGHEYTRGNLGFARKVLGGGDEGVRWLEGLVGREEVTVGKVEMGEERRYNVFMRVGEEGVRGAVGVGEGDGPVEVLARLREMKNMM